MCYHKPPAVASPKNSFKDFPRLEALFFFSLFMTLDWGRVLTSVHHRSVQQEPERLKQPAVVYQKQKQALKAVERTGWEGPPGPFWTNLPGAKGVQSQAGVTRWSLSTRTGRCRNPPTRYIASTSCAHDLLPAAYPMHSPVLQASTYCVQDYLNADKMSATMQAGRRTSPQLILGRYLQKIRHGALRISWGVFRFSSTQRHHRQGITHPLPLIKSRT